MTFWSKSKKKKYGFQTRCMFSAFPDAAASLMGYVSSSFPHLLHFFVKKLKVSQSDLDSAYSKTLCNAVFVFFYYIFAKRFFNHLSFFSSVRMHFFMLAYRKPPPQKNLSKFVFVAKYEQKRFLQDTVGLFIIIYKINGEFVQSKS